MISYAQRGILLRRENPTGMVIGRPSQQRRVVFRRRNTVVAGKCALPSALLVGLCDVIVDAVLEKVGKLLSSWNTPMYSMHAIKKELRDPFNYNTIVRAVSPADRFATAVLMFCHYNDVYSMLIHCVPKKVPPLNMSKFLQKYITLSSYHLTA